MVAPLYRFHAFAHLDDDPGALVPQDRREQAFRIGSGKRELVGVADTGSLDLDQHLARLRPLQLHCFDG